MDKQTIFKTPNTLDNLFEDEVRYKPSEILDQLGEHLAALGRTALNRRDDLSRLDGDNELAEGHRQRLRLVRIEAQLDPRKEYLETLGRIADGVQSLARDIGLAAQIASEALAKSRRISERSEAIFFELSQQSYEVKIATVLAPLRECSIELDSIACGLCEICSATDCQHIFKVCHEQCLRLNETSLVLLSVATMTQSGG